MKLLKYFSFLIPVTLLCFSATAQKIETSITYLTAIPGADDNTIVYDQHRKLNIEDFKGRPDNDNVAVAITTSGFTFKAGYRNANGKATLLVSVYCSFDKSSSWMKEKAKNDYILLHEQQHFNISYISTMLFIKKLKKLKFNQDGYMNQLKEAYNEAIKDMEDMQHQYDGDTNNGILKDKQAAWNKKIGEQLDSLIKENN